MRIGFDGKRVFHNKRGLGNYARSLLTALGDNYNEHNYFIYTPSLSKVEAENKPWEKKPYCVRTPESISGKLFSNIWRSTGIKKEIKKDNLDIYHGLSQELPHGIENLPLRSLVTIHDLLCIRYPHNFGTINAKIYEYKLRQACKVADKIIAVSEQTRKDIIDLLKVNASKIEVIYPACQKHFYKEYAEEEKEKIKERYALPLNFILYVGAFESNKNVISLAKAYREYKKENNNYALVLVGKKNTYRNKIEKYLEESGLKKEVIFLENVHDLDLAIVFQLASLFVFPSFFEGFGIPVAEAMASKTPVITSKSSSLVEVGGEATLYTDPVDTKTMAAKIKEVLHNSSLREELISKGIKQSEKFHESEVASKYMHSYKSLGA